MQTVHESDLRPTVEEQVRQAGWTVTSAPDHRQATLERWRRQPTLRQRLRSLPPLDDDRLAAHQTHAVSAIEESLCQGRPRSLVALATGTGKTVVASTVIARLLEHAGAERIL